MTLCELLSWDRHFKQLPLWAIPFCWGKIRFNSAVTARDVQIWQYFTHQFTHVGCSGLWASVSSRLLSLCDFSAQIVVRIKRRLLVCSIRYTGIYRCETICTVVLPEGEKNFLKHAINVNGQIVDRDHPGLFPSLRYLIVGTECVQNSDGIPAVQIRFSKLKGSPQIYRQHEASTISGTQNMRRQGTTFVIAAPWICAPLD